MYNLLLKAIGALLVVGAIFGGGVFVGGGLANDAAEANVHDRAAQCLPVTTDQELQACLSADGKGPR